jgi:hypothetical protein
MIKIPYQQTEDRQFNQFQQALGASLMPILSNPIAACIILQNVILTTGSVNQVPIMIGRTLQGWFIVRQNAQANIWDSQATETSPTEFLALNTTANVTVNIAIF